MDLDDGKRRVPKQFFHGTEFMTRVFHSTSIFQGVSSISTYHYISNMDKILRLFRYMSSFYLGFVCQWLTHLSSGDNVYVTSHFHRYGGNK